VSPLKATLPRLDSFKFSLNTALRNHFWQAAIIWTAVFFCACHLPAMGLAHQRETRTMESLLVSPAGWTGVVWSTVLFHMLLAVATAQVLLLIVPMRIPYSIFLPVVVIVAGAHLSISFTIGLSCRTTVGASGGVMGYLMAASILAALINAIPTIPIAASGVDLGLVMTISAAAANSSVAQLSMGLMFVAVWASVWFVLARLTLQRLRCP
jgi:ABC-type Na+ efflux pump permease subunit